MDTKNEGPLFPPLPMVRRPRRESATRNGQLKREAVALRCEMCGAEVIESHCKRICLSCGFMTGCSEGT